MKHIMRLNDSPFSLIQSGRKTIELRLYDEKRQAICVGDQIEFVHSADNSRKLLCTVLALHVFDSFKSLYESLPLLKCGYTEEDVSTAAYTDMEEYYSAEQQQRYGVVGIEIKIV